MFAWQATVQDEDGNIVPLPVVTVYQSDGSTLADIYDETGSSLSNPLTGTLEGFVQFWANPGKYRIIGTNGGVTSEWFVDGGGLDSAAIPIASHSVAETVNVNPDIDVLRVMAGGRMLEYVRDPSGTALQTSDGAWWSPADTVTPQHWGAVADGVVDCSDAIEACVAWVALRGGEWFAPAGIYRTTRSIDLKGTSFYGEGQQAFGTVFRPELALGSSTRGAFYSTVAFDFARVVDVQFHLASVYDANSALDCEAGAIRSYFRILIDGGARVTGKHGLVIRGVNPVTGLANNLNYNNLLEHCDIRQCDIGIYLYGQDVTNARLNANKVFSGRLSGNNINLYMNGQNNIMQGVTLNPAVSGRSLVVEGNQCFNNLAIGCYFDNSSAPDMIYINTGSARVPISIIECVGLNETNVTNASTVKNQIVSVMNGRTTVASIPSPSSARVSIVGYRADEMVHIKGSEGVAGGVILAGGNYAGGAAAVSNAGGASIVIKNDPAALFRLVKTADGVSFDRVLEINGSGVVNYRMTPTQTTVGSAGVASALPAAPSGYLEIQINGVARVIPFYNKGT